MTENLRATTYNDGTPIPLIDTDRDWEILRADGYCFYNDSLNDSEKRKWGALYNWFVIETGKLAPDGWRVPTREDWDTLAAYLEQNGFVDTVDAEITTAKALASKTDWLETDNANGIGDDLSENNSSGFYGYPAGYRNTSGGSYGLNENTMWWTSTKSFGLNAFAIELYYVNSNILSGQSKSIYKGYSVRLVRDAQ